ncbi:MAG: hypothetical protein VX899_25045 [Myxococcota bacterium]|nr:hypothetical protein [Myxococcota bacterium]
MTALLALLACNKDVSDSGSGTECGRLVDHPGTSFAVEAIDWQEGRSLYEVGEPSDQTHTSQSLWLTFLDVHGREDPIPDADWEGKDLLLWLNRYDGCEEREYTWLDPFVRDGDTRVVPGEYTEDPGCDLQWTEAWIFLIDEVEGADDADACADSGA